MAEEESNMDPNWEVLKSSPLYSEDLAPVPQDKRTWNTLHLASLWVGMAVCIPTYMLASYMIRSGLNWIEALIIIGVANLIITVPMVLNGHAGVKYGIPFPVLGRAAFGTKGIHIASSLRALVACGWFGVQTWIGGLAIYEIINAISGDPSEQGINFLKLFCFLIFWLINLFFIWKGNESIKWLEQLSAPILIVMGLMLIGWGVKQAGGFAIVLDQSDQLRQNSAVLSERNDSLILSLHPLNEKSGNTFKAQDYQVIFRKDKEVIPSVWMNLDTSREFFTGYFATEKEIKEGERSISVSFRGEKNGKQILSSEVKAIFPEEAGSKIWGYILWLTAMVGFWATMSISISDITRYSKSQKTQVAGQFIGLPGTMMLYSFIGIFVTCAAVITFDDILVAEDAPWDPVSLLARFDSPVVVIIAQLFMIIATLSTNIAANVIAPANAFSNLFPKKISFKAGGFITGLIGIAICPWWLMDQISGILIFISGLLGPVLGILICDYYWLRKTKINVSELFREEGIYRYNNGFNPAAIIALIMGTAIALIGYWVPALSFLYSLSWFSGFTVSFFVYFLLMKSKVPISKDLQ